MSNSNVTDELGRKTREELFLLAKSLKIINYRDLRKSELIVEILSCGEQRVARILHPTWWQRYHNHVYGAASVVGLVLTVVFFFWPSSSSHAESGGIETPVCFADFARMTPSERKDLFDEYQGTQVIWEGYFKSASGFEPGGLHLQVEEPVGITIAPAKGDFVQIFADCRFGILGGGDAGYEAAMRLILLSFGQRVRVSGTLAGDSDKPVVTDAFLEGEWPVRD
jgi:hypothetical protein